MTFEDHGSRRRTRVRLDGVIAVVLALAAGQLRADADATARIQLKREQAARQLELKLEQWQLKMEARSRSSTSRTGTLSDPTSRGTRLPIESIRNAPNANERGNAVTERRRLRTLFDRERFEQRELHLNQQRRAMASRAAKPSIDTAAGNHRRRLRIELQRFRMEQRQQLQRFRMEQRQQLQRFRRRR